MAARFYELLRFSRWNSALKTNKLWGAYQLRHVNRRILREKSLMRRYVESETTHPGFRYRHQPIKLISSSIYSGRRIIKWKSPRRCEKAFPRCPRRWEYLHAARTTFSRHFGIRRKRSTRSPVEKLWTKSTSCVGMRISSSAYWSLLFVYFSRATWFALLSAEWPTRSRFIFIDWTKNSQVRFLRDIFLFEEYFSSLISIFTKRTFS